MGNQTFKAFCLTIGIAVMTQFSHSAVINETNSKTTVAPLVKASPIEKALQQQRADKNRLDNSLKVLTSINVPPTQSFLAAQNERFSRFIQSLFAQNNS
jgi:hypothetical protein